MVDNDGGGDVEEATMRDLEDVKLFEEIANFLDHDDILFGSLRWLENFRRMKQATTDPFYKNCLKHWTALCFNLQILMLKA
jgi:hypothetical protein